MVSRLQNSIFLALAGVVAGGGLLLASLTAFYSPPVVSAAGQYQCKDGTYVPVPNSPTGQELKKACDGHDTAPGTTTCVHGFLGLEPWFQYIPKSEIGADCGIKCFNVFNQSKPNDCGETGSDLPRVALAIVDDLLRIAGLVAVGFIIYAAFNFITSQGNPEDATNARHMAINALIGLLLAMFAIVLVSFIGKSLGS